METTVVYWGYILQVLLCVVRLLLNQSRRPLKLTPTIRKNNNHNNSNNNTYCLCAGAVHVNVLADALIPQPIFALGGFAGQWESLICLGL